MRSFIINFGVAAGLVAARGAASSPPSSSSPIQGYDASPYEWRKLRNRPLTDEEVSLPTTAFTDEDFPVFRQKEREFYCELCQSMVHVGKEILTERLKKATGDKGTGGIKRKTYGDFDTILSEMASLTDSGLCREEGKWKWVADRSEVYSQSVLSRFCLGILEDHDESFIAALERQKSEEETSRELCVNDLQVCKEDYLWRSGDRLEERDTQADRNLAMSTLFMEKNARRDGVLVSASGLQYEVLKQGIEPLDDTIKELAVQYNGTLINGVSFDVSSTWGDELVGEVSSFVPGLHEAAQLVGVGGEVIAALHPGLAYGEEGAAHMVGPNAAVIYRMNILRVASRHETTTTTEPLEVEEEEVKAMEDEEGVGEDEDEEDEDEEDEQDEDEDGESFEEEEWTSDTEESPGILKAGTKSWKGGNDEL